MPKKMTCEEKIRKYFPNIDETLRKEMVEVWEYFLEKGYSDQALIGKYFPAFVEGGLRGDLLKRSLKIRDLKYAFTEEKSILMRGEKNGKEFWEKYREFQRIKNTKEYKMKFLGWSEEQFEEYNKSRAVTLENCIRRHGKEKGEKVFNDYKEKQKRNGCSLEWFQEKLGPEEGKLYYEHLNAKKAITIENLTEKYGVNQGRKKYFEYVDKISSSRKGFSKISQTLFWEIDEFLEEKSYFAEKNKEFGKYDEKFKRYYFYDFVVPDLKICIEFNGDDWHANPDIYKDKGWKSPVNESVTKEEVWFFDKMKKQCLENEGFKVITIWESDYKKDRNKVLQFIFKEIENARNKIH